MLPEPPRQVSLSVRQFHAVRKKDQELSRYTPENGLLTPVVFFLPGGPPLRYDDRACTESRPEGR
jgi:hypothetical protein